MRALRSLFLLALRIPASVAAQPLPEGPEIVVSAPERQAREPSLTAAGDGFVAVWTESTPDGSARQVVARRLAAGGSPLSEPVVVLVAPSAHRPRVDGRPDGSFGVTWQQDGVWARAYGADGAPTSEAFRVHLVDGTFNFSPDVVALDGGDLLVAWNNDRVVPIGPDFYSDPAAVRVRRFGPDGAARGVTQTVHEQFAELSYELDLARDPDGDLLVVWDLSSGESSFEDVFARPLDSDGVPLASPFMVNPRDGDTFRGPQLGARAVAIGNDRFLVAWRDEDDSGYGIALRPVAPVGPSGEQRQANQIGLGDQLQPALAALASGETLVAWHDDRGAGTAGSDGFGVFARWHSEAGSLGDDFRIHLDRSGDQVEVAVASHPDGHALAAWIHSEAAFHPSAASSLRARRLSPTCTPGDHTLCLAGGRFRVEVFWRTRDGRSGPGRTAPLTADSGTFWFFRPGNLELAVKVLDARSVDGHFWVFYGSLTNIDFDLVVTDTGTGRQRVFHNPQGTMASTGLRREFPAPPSAAVDPTAIATPVRSEQAVVQREACAPDPAVLCLRNRFEVRVDWRKPSGQTGTGSAVPLSGDTGALWFFRPGNVELLVKMIDGRARNGHFWLFFGALSNVHYTLRVRDTETGAERVYENQQGVFASRSDLVVF